MRILKLGQWFDTEPIFKGMSQAPILIEMK
jgi:hypothetical protein